MKNILVVFILSIVFVSFKPKDEAKLPVDKTATKETVSLYNQLFKGMKKGIMLGHQDDLAYGHSWYGEAGRSDVKDMTGDYPALIGFELGHIEIGDKHNLDSVYFSDMKKYVKETHQRGGIVTFSWHGDNICTGKTAWDCLQDTVVRSVLPGGVNHKKYLVWLDRLANFFLELKDSRGVYIPVVFRMYHEHTGSWFWWGSKQCTPTEYKQLWRMTEDYLNHKKNVHNLLFAYSTSNARDEVHYLERYPGDKYVDILGFDHYLKGTTPDSIEKYKVDFDRNIQIVTKLASKYGKLPIIGETGMQGIPDTTYFTQIVYPIIDKYQVAWILFWRNAWEKDKPFHHYLPYPEHQSESDFKKFVLMPRILMNNDMNKN